MKDCDASCQRYEHLAELIAFAREKIEVFVADPHEMITP